LADAAIFARRQSAIKAFQLRIQPRRRLSRFHPAKSGRNELPCLLIFPSRCFPPLDSSLGISPK